MNLLSLLKIIFIKKYKLIMKFMNKKEIIKIRIPLFTI